MPSPQYNDREKRILWRLQMVKTLPFIFLIMGLVVYQGEALNSLEKLSFTFDFSNYLEATPSGVPFPIDEFQESVENIEALTQGEGIENVVDFFVSYVGASNVSETVNLTAAEATIFLEDPLLITEIESDLGYVVENASQIYLAYLNGDLNVNYLISFLRDLWFIAFESFIPERWFQNGSIFVTNGGFMALKQLSLFGEFTLRGNSAVFLSFQQDRFNAGETVELEITIANLINAIAEIAFDDLVNITLSLLPVEPVGILKSFQEYIANLFNNIEISAQINLKATVGLISLEGLAIIDFKSIIQRRGE